MCNGNDGAFVLLQVLLEPVDAFGIEVVGRLIEQQYIRLLQQQTAQRDTSPFTSRKVFDQLVAVWTTQRIHRSFQGCIEFPTVFVVDGFGQLSLTFDQLGHLAVVHRLHEFGVHLLILLEQGDHFGTTLFNHFTDRLVVVQFRLLLQVADGISGREDHFTLKILIQSGDDLHQCRFSGSIQTDNADFGTVKKREVDVIQYFFLVGEDFADPHHREDNFFVCHRFNSVYAFVYLF